MEPPLSPEDFALLSRRLERIARDLALEPGSTDDLVQEAWLASLRAKGAPLRHPLRWMRVVMRRRSTQQHARARLRRECEELAARFEAIDDDEAERASAAALVTAELAQVDSPYREVLRLRFLEDCSVKEIAARSGRSPETVRSQIHRGLARLRERLDRRAGSRDVWAGLLLNAAGIDVEEVARDVQQLESASPVPVSSVAAIVTLFVVVPLGILAWRAMSPGTTVDPVLPTSATDPSPAAIVQETPPAEASREPVATPAVATVEPAPEIKEAQKAPPEIPAHVARLRVLVRDEMGAPISDAYGDFLGRDRKALPCEFDAAGTAVLDVRKEDFIDDPALPASVFFSVCAPGLAWSKSLMARLEPGAETAVEVTLDQPDSVLQGVVVDTWGAPTAGARVDAFAVPLDMNEIAPGVVAVSKMTEVATNTDGHFFIDGLPPGPHMVRVIATGFMRSQTELVATARDEAPQRTLQVQRANSLRGVVRYEDGLPVSGARVWIAQHFGNLLALRETRADEYGEYLLEGLGSSSPNRVFFADPNDERLFAETTIDVTQGGAANYEAVLEPTEGVRVRVDDADGQPVAGAMVVVAAEQAVAAWAARAVTNDEGRGVIQHVPDEPLELRVYPGKYQDLDDPHARRSGVRPSSVEIVLTLLSDAPRYGELGGRLLVTGEQEPWSASAYLFRDDEAAAQAANARYGRGSGLREAEVEADGSFSFLKLAPGRYHLYLACDLPRGAGTIDAGEHVVLSGERCESGEVALPNAHTVRFVRAPEARGGAARRLELSADFGDVVPPFLHRTVTDEVTLQLFAGVYRTRVENAQETQPLFVNGELEVTLRE